MKSKTRIIVECAIMIALSTILSLLKIWQMPLGGAITLLSMLPICIISIKHGIKWGFASSITYAIIQLLLDISVVTAWGLTPFVLISCFFFDYIFAFGILGIAGIFRKKKEVGMCAGIALALFLRFLSHFVSGYFLFAAWAPEGWNPLIYSISYNGAYMLPEMIFTMVATVIISKIPVLKKIIYSI